MLSFFTTFLVDPSFKGAAALILNLSPMTTIAIGAKGSVSIELHPCASEGNPVQTNQKPPAFLTAVMKQASADIVLGELGIAITGQLQGNLSMQSSKGGVSGWVEGAGEIMGAVFGKDVKVVMLARFNVKDSKNGNVRFVSLLEEVCASKYALAVAQLLRNRDRGNSNVTQCGIALLLRRCCTVLLVLSTLQLISILPSTCMHITSFRTNCRRL